MYDIFFISAKPEIDPQYKKLKLRYKIENTNCNLKKHERILVRKDRKLKYFMSFLYLASILNNIKCR